MRSLIRPLLPALFPALLLALTATAAGPAMAQDPGKPASPPAPSKPAPKSAAPAKPGKAKTLTGSPMAQVMFSEPAYPLGDDGTYRDYLAGIIAEYGRRCIRQEQFGWELAKDDQARLDHIFQGTMAAFGKTGYLVGEVKPKAIVDPDTIAFLADRGKHRLLLGWVPMQTSGLLMMCDTDAVIPRKQ